MEATSIHQNPQANHDEFTESSYRSQQNQQIDKLSDRIDEEWQKRSNEKKWKDSRSLSSTDRKRSRSHKRNHRSRSRERNVREKEPNCGVDSSTQRNHAKYYTFPKPPNFNEDKGDWRCQDCGNWNFATRTHCNNCKIQKPYKEGSRRQEEREGNNSLRSYSSRDNKERNYDDTRRQASKDDGGNRRSYGSNNDRLTNRNYDILHGSDRAYDDQRNSNTSYKLQEVSQREKFRDSNNSRFSSQPSSSLREYSQQQKQSAERKKPSYKEDYDRSNRDDRYNSSRNSRRDDYANDSRYNRDEKNNRDRDNRDYYHRRDHSRDRDDRRNSRDYDRREDSRDRYSSGGLSKKPFQKKDGDWECLYCKNINYARRNECNRCKKPKE